MLGKKKDLALLFFSIVLFTPQNAFYYLHKKLLNYKIVFLQKISKHF